MDNEARKAIYALCQLVELSVSIRNIPDDERIHRQLIRKLDKIKVSLSVPDFDPTWRADNV